MGRRTSGYEERFPASRPLRRPPEPRTGLIRTEKSGSRGWDTVKERSLLTEDTGFNHVIDKPEVLFTI